MASAGRINEVFAMKPGIVDGNEKESAVQQTEEPKTAVSMEDVTFYYQKSKEPALEHISFTAKKVRQSELSVVPVQESQLW